MVRLSVGELLWAPRNLHEATSAGPASAQQDPMRAMSSMQLHAARMQRPPQTR